MSLVKRFVFFLNQTKQTKTPTQTKTYQETYGGQEELLYKLTAMFHYLKGSYKDDGDSL